MVKVRDIDDRYAINEKGNVYDKYPPKKKAKRKTFLQEIKRIAKEKGYSSLSEFVNNWVSGGQTFTDLKVRLELEENIVKDEVTIWKYLRNYLTIPYSWEDQFWYKYNSIAKTKGFKDVNHMVYIFNKRKLSWDKIAEELGLTKDRATIVIKRLMRGRIEGNPKAKRQYIRHKHRKRRNKDGVSHIKKQIVWHEKLAQHGFRSFRDAIWRLKKKQGVTYQEIAKLFGISTRNLYYRRRRAGI